MPMFPALILTILLSPPPLAFDLQGHRGARALAPENTLAAFARALGIGVTTLELDVVVTRDEKLVVHHDLDLSADMTRDGAGRWLLAPTPPVRSLTLDALRRYDVGRAKPGSAVAERFARQQPADGERIPTLADVFALAARAGNGQVRFNIETKIDPRRPDASPHPEAFAKLLVGEIRAAGLSERASIQSFDWRTLAVARRIAPEIERVCLSVQAPGEDNVMAGRPGAPPTLAGFDVDSFGGSVPKVAKAAGCTTWSPHAGNLTPDALRDARAEGLRVVPWTVNERADMERLLDAGVDGLITDDPALLRQVLVERGRPVPAATPVTTPTSAPATSAEPEG